MILGRPTFAVAVEVIQEAASIFGVDPWVVVRAGNERTTNLVRVRWAVIWCLRQLRYADGKQAYSYPRIARALRYADHTTARHGFAEAEFWRGRDTTFREKTDRLMERMAPLWWEAAA